MVFSFKLQKGKTNFDTKFSFSSLLWLISKYEEAKSGLHNNSFVLFLYKNLILKIKLTFFFSPTKKIETLKK